jgi:hypothetical protein
MEQYDQLIRDIFLNKTLNEIEFFDTDMRYFSPDMYQTWIVDGGIQLKIDEQYISFAYATEYQFYNIFLGKVEEVRTDEEVNSLGACDVEAINALLGKTVTDVKALWNFYKELDENFEEVDEKKYMPLEIVLTFNDGSLLQMAAIEYKVMGDKIANLRYNSERELLISVNKKVEIAEAE